MYCNTHNYYDIYLRQGIYEPDIHRSLAFAWYAIMLQAIIALFIIDAFQGVELDTMINVHTPMQCAWFWELQPQGNLTPRVPYHVQS